MVRVILDAMGGDHAPQTSLDGVALAIEREHLRPDEIVLVGHEKDLVEALRKRQMGDIEVVDAPDELAGGESPIEAMRKKPKSSISVGIGLVKAGRGDAFVSAGNTGLVVATATLGLGTLEGVRRPGIAIVINGDTGPFMVIDVGANPQPKARHLLLYGIMGAAYYRDTFGTQSPQVGLMNIGSEDQKGNPLSKEAGGLLRASNLNFIGNVEGVDLFKGNCEVVVCDGFTGNVLLKVSEGLAEHLMKVVAGLIVQHGLGREETGRVIQEMRSLVDYSSYGGALLLGVNGIVTICHGRSEGPAICNAIRFAHQAVGARIKEHTVAMIRQASGVGETNPGS